ncbi:MAG TPA: family 10 glycosylhydrolase [Opitutaceae bacterium]|nr:family 10 glycosylhydrolase [Opitutaceae bacterium]
MILSIFGFKKPIAEDWNFTRLNPYRARQAGAKSSPAKNHISRTHPAVVKTYGDLLWMDPGEPTAVERTLAVVRDVVQRYDVDGIHVDDYFYPYPIPVPGAPRPPDLLQPGTSPPPVPEVEFPDDPSWQRYLTAGGTLSRPAWRRQQVVLEMGKTVKQIKPWVRFGVSPFGIGRPELRPAGIEGFSQYDKLYADVERWWEEGWVDYLAPQLYWPIEQKPQAFGVLLKYWAENNRSKRHLWPGLYTSRINATDKSWNPTEIEQQIALIRSNSGASGHIHFSMVALAQNRRGVSDQLARSTYSSPALVPATPWLERDRPSEPRMKVTPQTSSSGATPAIEVRFLESTGKKPALYSVWSRRGKVWQLSVVPASNPSLTLSNMPSPSSEGINRIVVTAIDRVGNESPRTTLSLPSK